MLNLTMEILTIKMSEKNKHPKLTEKIRINS